MKIDTMLDSKEVRQETINVAFAANITNMVTDTMLDLKEIRQQTINGLSIGTMNADPG